MKTSDLHELSVEDLSRLSSGRLEEIYLSYLEQTPSLELKNAMEYSLLNGGKRLRPLLVYAAACTFKSPLENADIPAAAVELIHTYSLIHDDLPCMDDSDMRRGRLANHKQFGEGMAVLAGDALHTFSMQLISSHPASLKAESRVAMMEVLSKACGPFGMAAGQALDLTVMSDDSISTRVMEDIYRLKTGALFSACLELGWLASENDDGTHQKAMREFGDCIGLAFQIQDDILDLEASSEDLGKPSGIDQRNNKFTYPKMHGLDHARQKVESLYEQALQAINYLSTDAQILRELANVMLKREK